MCGPCLDMRDATSSSLTKTNSPYVEITPFGSASVPHSIPGLDNLEDCMVSSDETNISDVYQLTGWLSQIRQRLKKNENEVIFKKMLQHII